MRTFMGSVPRRVLRVTSRCTVERDHSNENASRARTVRGVGRREK